MSDRTYIHTEDARSNDSSGHLNSTWEIAILIIFIVLIVAIIATSVFQIRRKRQRRRDREVMDEAEMGMSRTDGTRTVMSEKTVIQEPKRAASPPWHTASSASLETSRPQPSKHWPDHR